MRKNSGSTVRKDIQGCSKSHAFDFVKCIYSFGYLFHIFVYQGSYIYIFSMIGMYCLLKFLYCTLMRDHIISY